MSEFVNQRNLDDTQVKNQIDSKIQEGRDRIRQLWESVDPFDQQGSDAENDSEW